MAKVWSYFLFLLWISYLMTIALLLFTEGFLLNKVARTEKGERTIGILIFLLKFIYRNDFFFSSFSYNFRNIQKFHPVFRFLFIFSALILKKENIRNFFQVNVFLAKIQFIVRKKVFFKINKHQPHYAWNRGRK